MFSLAFDARPQLQAEVPAAEAKNKTAVGKLKI